MPAASYSGRAQGTQIAAKTTPMPIGVQIWGYCPMLSAWLAKPRYGRRPSALFFTASCSGTVAGDAAPMYSKMLFT